MLVDSMACEPVDVAPHPAFARFDGPHQWMLAPMEMFGCALVFGRVTTSNIAALQAKPKMDPPVPHFDAFFADALVCAGDLYLVEMGTGGGH
jgi:hypothetical protein